jgi:hypothetical protein
MMGDGFIGGECGKATTTHYPMPFPATTDEPWWSYDVGLVHMVGISTEHNYTVGSKQYRWLENDLRTVNRTRTPWVIFGGHRAMYLHSNYSGPGVYARSLSIYLGNESSNLMIFIVVTSDATVMDLMIDNLEPLLYKYRVNIGFYGHNHVVQRHAAVYQKKVVQHAAAQTVKNAITGADETVYVYDNPQATVHWVIGTGGADFTVTATEPKPDWNEDYFYLWGYSVVKAVNSTYLTMDWINSANDETVIRSVFTQKDPNHPWVQ